MITMYDTKTREIFWNATYYDYSAPLYNENMDYSKFYNFIIHLKIDIFTYSQLKFIEYQNMSSRLK